MVLEEMHDMGDVQIQEHGFIMHSLVLHVSHFQLDPIYFHHVFIITRNEVDVIKEIVGDVLLRLNHGNSKAAFKWSRLANFEEKKEALSRKLSELESIEADINEQLKIVEFSGKKRKNEVANWLANVQRIKGEHRGMQFALRKETVGSVELENCVNRFIEEVRELIRQKSGFEKDLVFDAIQTNGEVFPEKRLVGREFQSNVELIWKWLNEDDVSSIGIYGMGGVGKTTLVIHIHNKLLDKQEVFGQIYWITVSQDFSVYKLQYLLANAIGLEFGTEEDEKKRAAWLSKALSAKEKFILILDDLWNRFDMKKVGIPIEKKGCKWIITTRSKEVSLQMGLQKLKKIEPLSEDESWYLFMETLRDNLAMNVEAIAKSVARECAGLPLGIVTLAGSMRGVDDIHEWNHALTELQRSEVWPEDMGDEVFRVLRFSYTRLKDLSLQQCFLYCALFPEDYEIDREELIQSLIAEGIIEQRMSRRMDFDKGHVMLNKLVKLSLLVDVTKEDGARYVGMHDLIRDMAIQIMKESSPSIIEAGRQLKSVPDQKYWTKDIVRVSLVRNDIKKIPSNHSSMCSNLSTLLLSQNRMLYSIPDSFFLHLHGLQVLDLSNSGIVELPESVGCLRYLKALFLRWCLRLRYLPSFVKLASLEMLDLSFCMALEQAPPGLELLSSLTFLNLFETGVTGLKGQMLTGLSNLQFLAYYERYGSLQVTAEDLAELQKLDSLYWRFRKYYQYVNFLSQSGRQLTSYFLSVGDGGRPEGNKIKVGPSSREVYFFGCDIPRELFIHKDVQILRMKNVTIIGGSGFCFKTAPEMNSSEAELNSLFIAYCEWVKYLFHLSSSPVIPEILETLVLHFLPQLRALFGRELEEQAQESIPFLPCATMFSSLKRFIICRCDAMKMLFPPLLFFNFENLEEIVVESCLEMEEIIAATEVEASNGYNHLDLMENYNYTLPKLRVIALEKLPKLKRICSEQVVCDSLQLFSVRDCNVLEKIPISLPLPSLRTVRVWPEAWWKSVQWGIPDQKSVLRPEFDPRYMVKQRNYIPKMH